ncbi:hypothetical protein F5882DRAFT_460374 [Hyaloscypha sp. PMI_1271]|nr:hypothetical protein F5882DRAFT_460374 [Hyaloscypha sp. PMI_1271]
MASNGPADADQFANQERSLQDYLTSNETVKIYVGPKRKLWFLNEELLCDRVPFFKSAFKSGWKEGESKVMKLPDDDPETFGHLVGWVYTKALNCKFCASPPPGHRVGSHVDAGHELQWLKLWVLADRMNLTKLGDDALDVHLYCISKHNLVVSPEAVILACENPAGDGALRKHLVGVVLNGMFQSRPGSSNGLGVGAAANASFNQEVMDAIQNHLQIAGTETCPYYDCPIHYE